MATTLNTQYSLVGDHYLVTGSLVSGGTLPTAVFIYTNTGEGTLGEFFGTCSLSELGRFQVFNLGTPIPVFGNKFVRYDQIKIKVALNDDPVSVIAALLKNVTSLSKAYGSQLVTNSSFVIP